VNNRKYIEKQSGTRNSWSKRKYHRLKHKNSDSDFLPFRESMSCRETNKSYHCFKNYNHLKNFLESRIGYNWNDVYSEMISKLKKKYRYRYELDNQWSFFNSVENNVLYDENGVPTTASGRTIIYINGGNFYINSDNRLAYYPNLAEYHRQIKIKKFKKILGEDYDDLAVIREMMKLKKKEKYQNKKNES